MSFDTLAQSMLDACAETLGSSITVQQSGFEGVNAAGGRDVGTRKSMTLVATTIPSDRVSVSGGGAGGVGADLYATAFKVRQTEIDALVTAGTGFQPRDGDGVIHGSTTLTIAGAPGSTTNGLDVVLVCRTSRPKKA